jgi:hypothetical protein
LRADGPIAPRKVGEADAAILSAGLKAPFRGGGVVVVAVAISGVADREI